jgi:DNA-binding transcriptional LysR family regulator
MAPVVREGVFIGQLQAFIEVARLGNVTRAADTLYLTQPALTARLKRLEGELGVSLLLRNRSGARLTEAGQAFLAFAEKAVGALEEADCALKALRTTGSDLVLGATQTMGTYLLPPAIKLFTTTYPDVRLTLRMAPSPEIFQSVLRGSVDVGLCRTHQHPDVECSPLYEEEFIVVVAPSHPRAADEGMRMADFAHELLLLYNSSSSGEFTKALQQHAGVAPRSVIDIDGTEAAKRLVLQGVGLGLLPRLAVASELADGRLRHVPILDMPPLRRTMSVIRRRGSTDSAAIRAFLATLAPYLGPARSLNRRPSARAARGGLSRPSQASIGRRTQSATP